MTCFSNKLKRIIKITNSLGIKGGIIYLLKERLYILHRTKSVRNILFYPHYRLYSRGCTFPLLCRPGTSDRCIFEQIFIAQQYSTVNYSSDPSLIIDCGANVGYSSVYFLNRFPKAKVIAIEPHSDNFVLLQHNLRPYGNRAQAICSAVWSHQVGLIIEYQGHGKECTTKVRECIEGESPDLIATDMKTLLDKFDLPRIDILKIDVEGAEAAMFSKNCDHWIDKVALFAIELHGEACWNMFYRALNPDRFEFSRFGEVTIAKRINTIEDA
jgi:FkbM family methyltransferase